MATHGLVHGPLDGGSLHICVDMQRLFSHGSPWSLPWMEKVLPAIEAIVEAHPQRTVFTRFIPVRQPGEGTGTWARYYRRWSSVTLANLGEGMTELVPQLARFVPPGRIVDKMVYSPWTEGRLDHLLHSERASALVITGGETDVCVLATVLGAIDRGFRVILVTDAVCSSSDPTHDALMELYRTRFSEQVEAASTEEVLRSWGHC